MNAILERNNAHSPHERFEHVIAEHAPYILQEGFRLTNQREYAEVLQSIENHKYLINERIPFEITMEQALFSWYENVYRPMTRVIDEEGLLWCFPKATPGQLFLWVTRHWHFLKQEKQRDISMEEAVYSFGIQYGSGVFNRFLYRLRRKSA